MNLIDENFEEKKLKEDKNKKIAKIILILMGVILVVIIGLIGAMAYIKSSELQVYLNGSANSKIKEMMVKEDDGTIYFPIKEIASYLGYKSYNGEYSDKSEDKNKCYVQCNDEVANFTINSKKIYKLTTTQNNSNYEYYYTDKPVKAINGKLYATSDGIEKAFNVSFSFNDKTNKGYIYTMPYLIETYTSKILDYGYSKIDENFTNQKSVLNSMLIVYKEDDKSYGVIDLKGNAVIEAKYDGITFLPNTGDFLVKSNNKVGTISDKRETKIPINYESLELIDSDLALYLAKKDNKYGIIDSRGNVKIYIEYDEIGIDNTKFQKNDIKNKYLIANGLIPVRKDKTWALFDKNGNQLTDFEYDSFGYIASSNKDAINLLVVPDYDVIVACKNKKYTLINSSGKTIFAALVDDIYMTISSGQKHYYMNFNDRTEDVETVLDVYNVKKSNNSNSNNNSNTNSNSSTSNDNNINNTMVENDSNNDEESTETDEQQTDSEQEEE